MIKRKRTGVRAFTLVESLISTGITVFIMLAAWNVYTTATVWSRETEPRIDAQRTARITIERIVEGVADSTAGTDTINSTTYRRRNGLIWAMSPYQGDTTPTIVPTISTDTHEIAYALEADIQATLGAASNLRGFKMGASSVEGENALFYKNSTGTWTEVKGTRGIVDLIFEHLNDDNSVAAIFTGRIRITVKVEKTIRRLNSGPQTITATYSENVYLRDV